MSTERRSPARASARARSGASSAAHLASDARCGSRLRVDAPRVSRPRADAPLVSRLRADAPLVSRLRADAPLVSRPRADAPLVSRLRADATLVRAGLCALLIVLVGGAARAHDIPRTAMRELVRLQGFVAPPEAPADGASDRAADAPPGPSADPGSRAGETVLVVHGRELPFRLVDRQIFLATALANRPSMPEPPRLVLQGDRRLLARLSSARPDQRVTILGERRPGSEDLFVATLDLCPED